MRDREARDGAFQLRRFIAVTRVDLLLNDGRVIHTRSPGRGEDARARVQVCRTVAFQPLVVAVELGPGSSMSYMNSRNLDVRAESHFRAAVLFHLLVYLPSSKSQETDENIFGDGGSASICVIDGFAAPTD